MNGVQKDIVDKLAIGTLYVMFQKDDLYIWLDHPDTDMDDINNPYGGHQILKVESDGKIYHRFLYASPADKQMTFDEARTLVKCHTKLAAFK